MGVKVSSKASYGFSCTRKFKRRDSLLCTHFTYGVFPILVLFLEDRMCALSKTSNGILRGCRGALLNIGRETSSASAELRHYLAVLCFVQRQAHPKIGVQSFSINTK